MNTGSARILLIGYGNPGRLDDGLGPALAACIEALALPCVVVESDYQLTLEHAHDISQYDVAIFADADVAGREPFYFRRLVPTVSSGLGSHAVEPGEVLSLAMALFGATTRSYMLGIRGYQFNKFGEKLSDMAMINLAEAAKFISTVVGRGNFEEVSETYTGTATPGTGTSMDRLSLN